MYNKKSDYALNKKNKEAIVSRNAAGEYIKLARKKFASEEKFAHWKEWFDDNYRQEYNAEQSYKRFNNKLQKQAENKAVFLSVEQIILKEILKIILCLISDTFSSNRYLRPEILLPSLENREKRQPPILLNKCSSLWAI